MVKNLSKMFVKYHVTAIFRRKSRVTKSETELSSFQFFFSLFIPTAYCIP